MTVETCDILVIGAGSGGLSVAAGAAQMGAKVVLVESGEMGGDCLNSGCVPSKAMLAAARQAHTAHTSARFGVLFSAPRVDFAAVKAHVADVIAQIAPHDSQQRFESLGVTVVRARAQFVSARQVEAGGRRFSAKRFVIATGSRASIPAIAGLADTPYLTNETLFADTSTPEHLLIIGGGAIGCEMAQAHARLGCRVTLLDAVQLLPKDDPAAVALVRASLIADGVSVREGVSISAVAGTTGQIRLTLGSGEELTGSHLLVAAGRSPEVQGLGLEAAGIEFGRTGIRVDARLRTSQTHVFAIGDCRAGPQFTHAANYDATVVIRNLLFRLPARAAYHALPRVIYTDPELAQVGLTELEAQAAPHPVDVLCLGYDANDRAITERRTDGFVKIIRQRGRVVGVTVVGAHAGEQLALWTHVVGGKLRLSDIASRIMPYPTLQELGKRVAGTAFTGALYSAPTKSLVRLLLKLP